MSADARANLLLIGEIKDSLIVFKLNLLDIGKKELLKWNLIRTEYKQRTVKEGVFVNEGHILGVDKYGELFASAIERRPYVDGN